ncbi:hypothetical protein [Lentzea cavernae]|uniref:Uncharacterized protein n=1 Tax=Lentzea cavernae TaxID=2020703 RepID=A0ABQ3M9N8_9PSEU|nr:hypothetical protein [Lentzea cavernae]GHH35949.1 hypothetical protein GCM10017774_22030 [Lentzea cavernae]
MRPSQLQWASLLVIFINAGVILTGLLIGSPALPRAANIVLVVISVALMLITRLKVGNAIDVKTMTRPVWAFAVGVVAFFGGALLFAIPLLNEQLQNDPVANQRGWAGLALSFAGGTLLYAGLRRNDM